jgi:hypothetical protein
MKPSIRLTRILRLWAVALLLVLVAFSVIARRSSAAHSLKCCSQCDTDLVICINGGGHPNDCQAQQEECEETCIPDPCY